MTGGRRIRLTVNGPDTASAELELPVAKEPSEPAGSGDWVAPIPRSADDRAMGRHRYEVVIEGWRFEVTAEDARTAALRDRAARAAADHRPATGITLRAQIPGRVTRLWVAEGEQVEQGQRLLAVEAMKMENEIRAPHAGRIDGVRVEVGRLVERNDELLGIV